MLSSVRWLSVGICRWLTCPRYAGTHTPHTHTHTHTPTHTQIHIQVIHVFLVVFHPFPNSSILLLRRVRVQGRREQPVHRDHRLQDRN